MFDSGSSLDLISLNVVKNYKFETQKSSKTELCGAFGNNACVQSEVDLTIKIDNVMRTIRFSVVDTTVFDIIIGNPSLNVLKLRIQENNVFTAENRVFGFYGTDKQDKYNRCNQIDSDKNNSHIDEFFRKKASGDIEYLKDIRTLFYKYSNAFSEYPDDVSCMPEVDFSYRQEFTVSDNFQLSNFSNLINKKLIL